MGRIISDAFRLTFSQIRLWALFLVVMLVSFIPSLLASASPGASSLLNLVITFVVLPILLGGVYRNVADAVQQQPYTPFFKAGVHFWGRILGFILLGVLAGLILIIPFVGSILSSVAQASSVGLPVLVAVLASVALMLLVIAVLAFAFFPFLAAIIPAIVVEDNRIWRALARAWQIGFKSGRTGSWYALMGFTVLFMVVFYAIVLLLLRSLNVVSGVVILILLAFVQSVLNIASVKLFVESAGGSEPR